MGVGAGVQEEEGVGAGAGEAVAATDAVAVGAVDECEDVGEPSPPRDAAGAASPAVWALS